MKASPPRRVVALLLVLCTPCGTSHVYLGLPWRGIAWAVIQLATAALALVGTAYWIGRHFWLVVMGWALWTLLGWLGPVLDLALLDRTRFVRTGFFRVLGMALLLTAVPVTLSHLARTFWLEAFKIPSASMWPTLHLQDYVFVSKRSYNQSRAESRPTGITEGQPGYGDVIVFEYPDPERRGGSKGPDYVKRIAGLPGDTLEFFAGHPRINGFTVPSCSLGIQHYNTDGNGLREGELVLEYLGPHPYLTWYEAGIENRVQGPYQVPPGEVWVLGDNRNNSADSRVWNHGEGAGLPFSNIKGKVESVWLAFYLSGYVDVERLGTTFEDPPELPLGTSAPLIDGLERCLRERPSQTVPPVVKLHGARYVRTLLSRGTTRVGQAAIAQSRPRVIQDVLQEL